ncbi:hypothetical protein V2G26_007752 [Clonostachys chloroleuca]
MSADPFSFQSQHRKEPNKHTTCVDQSLLHQIIFRLNELEAILGFKCREQQSHFFFENGATKASYHG